MLQFLLTFDKHRIFDIFLKSYAVQKYLDY